eukprot:5544217-Lingulodinium_polyedra.AAC.1
MGRRSPAWWTACSPSGFLTVAALRPLITRRCPGTRLKLAANASFTEAQGPPRVKQKDQHSVSCPKCLRLSLSLKGHPTRPRAMHARCAERAMRARAVPTCRACHACRPGPPPFAIIASIKIIATTTRNHR